MTPLDPLALPLRGRNLVEASAGTGKTFTITTLFLRLLLEAERRIGEILVVTYTNAATAELRTRLRLRLAGALAAIEAAARGRALPSGTDAVLAALVEGRVAAGQLARDVQRLTTALYAFDDAAVFTIHGFCQRTLQDHAFESGMPFDLDLVTDQRSLVREIVRDFWVRELHGAPADFVRFIGGKARALDDLTSLALAVVGLRDVPVLPQAADLPPESNDGNALLLALKVRLVEHVRRELGRRKRDAGVLYFDDLLTQLGDALDGPGGELLARHIRQRYPAALIDEFQDTDPVQYGIFSAIYRGDEASLFLIGDPKQAIYGFRGADVYTYVTAKEEAGAAGGRTLDTNHRSDPRLVAAVNTLFGRAGVRLPFLRPEIAFEEVQPRQGAAEHLGGSLAGAPALEILHLAQTNGTPIPKGVVRPLIFERVANEIARLLAGGATIDAAPVQPQHVAVLCRKNDEARAIQRELRRLRIPSVLQTDQSVLETNEAEELGRVVHALAEPTSTGTVMAALATPMLGVLAEEIQAMRDGGEAWDEWADRFHRWHQVWLASGFMPALRTLLQEHEVEKRVLAGIDGERRMTNFLHLCEILQTSAVESRRGPLALAEWFDEVRQDRDARTDAIADAAQIRLESDDLALKLTTVHKSKGLEYPIVFCPFLWDGLLLRPNDNKHLRFRSEAPGGAQRGLAIDIGSAQLTANKELAKAEAQAENLRLLYVALTRARHRCVVVWGLFKDSETSALGYLLHQDADAPAAELAARTKARILGMQDAQLLAELGRLAAESEGTIGVAPLSGDPGPEYQRHDDGSDAPFIRSPLRTLRLGWRTASFSSLTAGGQHVSVAAEEGVDRDESGGDDGTDGTHGTDGTYATDASHADALPRPPGEGQGGGASVPIVLADFPAGTRAGQLVHAIFEHCDFSANGAALEPLVAEKVRAFGFDAAWNAALVRGIGEVLEAPLEARDSRFRLADIPSGARLNELEFLFSVREGTGDDTGLDSGRLAAAFARHDNALSAPYLERLRRLGFAPLSGYLKGFVDLVFRHRERWYVVDWKSNHLGADSHAYRPPRLVAAMEQHDYFLQYHLYVVALHRYLKLRLPDYDYERHFGGVFYLFVRGMSPHTPGNGVFFDRPPQALIDDLSEMM